MLRSLLQQERLLPMDRFRVRRALLHATCWPIDPGLAAHARRHGFLPPAARTSGHAPMISVSRGCATLWMLSPDATAGGGAAHLVETASEALQLAEVLAIRDAPLLYSLDELPPLDAWQPAFIVREGAGFDELLKGGSFGVSMLLAIVSRLLRLPLPGDIAASAAIEADGSVLPVDGLHEKIETFAGWGLGLRRVFVAAGQLEQARALADEAGASFEVVPVATARSAVAQAFGEVETRIADRLGASGGITEAVGSVFALALRNDRRILDWGVVERGAELLARLAPEGIRFQAEFARQVARRHQSKPARIPAPTPRELDALHFDPANAYYAHVLQSLSDIAAADCDQLLAGIRGRLPPPMQCPATQLELHGAVGRALRTLRRYDEASAQLRATALAWQASNQLDRGSWALAAWLHVLGIRGDRAGIDEALLLVERFSRLAKSDALSCAYVAFDCGRALVLANDPAPAAGWLADAAATWGLVHPHLRRSRLRWLAAAHRAMGDAGQAAAAMEQLRGEPDSIELQLAMLDEALAAGGALEAVLDRCRELEPELTGAYLDPALGIRAQAERLAIEYPY